MGHFPRLALLWADGGYAGKLVGWVASVTGWTLEIVKRSDDQKGFVVLPKRWIVERTFGWFGRYRRLSKDYEEHPPQQRGDDPHHHDSGHAQAPGARCLTFTHRL